MCESQVQWWGVTQTHNTWLGGLCDLLGVHGHIPLGTGRSLQPATWANVICVEIYVSGEEAHTNIVCQKYKLYIDPDMLKYDQVLIWNHTTPSHGALNTKIMHFAQIRRFNKYLNSILLKQLIYSPKSRIFAEKACQVTTSCPFRMQFKCGP